MLRKAITTDRNKVDSILKDTSSYSAANSSFTRSSKEPLNKSTTSLNPVKVNKNSNINNKTVNLGSISELSELKQNKTIKGGREPVKEPSPPVKKTMTKAPGRTKLDNRTTDGSSSFLGDESFYSQLDENELEFAQYSSNNRMTSINFMPQEKSMEMPSKSKTNNLSRTTLATEKKKHATSFIEPEYSSLNTSSRKNKEA
mmetsp:Transcript_36029/g.35012  ORF Transcript_36029/g.35012 Transcript_36029/m.35012 type:complete len:200 (-) Transcript_36029:55-654(-)